MVTVTAYNHGQWHQQDYFHCSSSPDLSQLPGWKTNICSLTHWAMLFNKRVKRGKKGKGRFSLNIFLPLNTSITCLRVSRDIPLYPLARTLILNANSMRVLSGVKGFPTPETVTEPSQLLTHYQQGQKRETPSNLLLPAECERTKFTWSSLQKKKYTLNLKKKSHQILFCTNQKKFLNQLSHLTPPIGWNGSLFFLSWKKTDGEGCTHNIPQITVWDDSPGKLSKTRGDSINNCKKCTVKLVKEGTWWSLLNNS